jgi:hypothetical protein
MSENNVQTCPRPQSAMTEERTKEIITEALIELGLLTQPQRKKLMPNVQPTNTTPP